MPDNIPEPGQAIEWPVERKPPTQAVQAQQQQRAPISIGERGVQLQDFEQLQRLANMILASGMAPKDFDSVPKISVAMLRLLELGMNPMTGLDCMAVVNGRPVLWGQGPLALVQQSGLMVPGSFRESFISGNGEAIKPSAMADAIKRADVIAVSRAERKGGDAGEGTFSISDAQRAGLWGKGGPWSQYPADMLRYKARARLLKGLFADVLRGTAIKEDLEGHETAPAVLIEPPKGNAAKLAARVDELKRGDAKGAEIMAEAKLAPRAETEPRDEDLSEETGALPGFADDESEQTFSTDPNN